MSVKPLYIALAVGVIMGVIGYAGTGEILPGLAGGGAAFVVVWGIAALMGRRKPPAT